MEAVIQKPRLKRVDVSMLITHALSNVVSIFVTTFLISYIYSISNNYILDIGLFYLFHYLSMFVFYFLVSRMIDKTDRITFYRIAIVVKGLFILSVVFLGKGLAKYVILAGALNGFSDACYWCSYNLMKNELISHHVMQKYALIQSFDTKGINMIVPLILGKIIDGESFKICAIIVLCVVALQLVFSIFIKSKRPENSSFCFKEFVSGYKAQEKEKRSLILMIIIIGAFYGMTSIVSPLNTIMIMISFESNFSLGIFTSIFAVFSMILLILLKKCTKLGKRTYIYYLCSILPVIAVALMIFKLNRTTVLIYSCVYTLSYVLYEFSYDVMRNLLLKKFKMYDSIAEFQCSIELSLEVGRIVVYLLMVIVGLLTAGLSVSALKLTMKILCGVSILFIVLMNITTAIYEKKFIKNVDVED